jgi:hypothetical protein
MTTTARASNPTDSVPTPKKTHGKPFMKIKLSVLRHVLAVHRETHCISTVTGKIRASVSNVEAGGECN